MKKIIFIFLFCFLFDMDKADAMLCGGYPLEELYDKSNIILTVRLIDSENLPIRISALVDMNTLIEDGWIPKTPTVRSFEIINVWKGQISLLGKSEIKSYGHGGPNFKKEREYVIFSNWLKKDTIEKNDLGEKMISIGTCDQAYIADLESGKEIISWLRKKLYMKYGLFLLFTGIVIFVFWKLTKKKK